MYGYPESGLDDVREAPLLNDLMFEHIYQEQVPNGYHSTSKGDIAVICSLSEHLWNRLSAKTGSRDFSVMKLDSTKPFLTVKCDL